MKFTVKRKMFNDQDDDGMSGSTKLGIAGLGLGAVGYLGYSGANSSAEDAAKKYKDEMLKSTNEKLKADGGGVVRNKLGQLSIVDANKTKFTQAEIDNYNQLSGANKRTMDVFERKNSEDKWLKRKENAGKTYDKNTVYKEEWAKLHPGRDYVADRNAANSSTLGNIMKEGEQNSANFTGNKKTAFEKGKLAKGFKYGAIGAGAIGAAGLAYSAYNNFFGGRKNNQQQ